MCGGLLFGVEPSLDVIMLAAVAKSLTLYLYTFLVSEYTCKHGLLSIQNISERLLLFLYTIFHENVARAKLNTEREHKRASKKEGLFVIH